FRRVLFRSEQPEDIQAGAVASDFFPLLRVRPLLGRTFTPAEDLPGQGRVVVLGYNFWRDHFASDPDVLGRSILLDGVTYSVVGVMPGTLQFPSWAKIWVPLAWTRSEEHTSE